MEIIINELALQLIREMLKDEMRDIMRETFGSDANSAIPYFNRAIDAAFRNEHVRRLQAVHGSDVIRPTHDPETGLEIIDVCPETGNQLPPQPLLPAIINNTKNELINAERPLLVTSECGEKTSLRTVTEHRPITTTPIEDYNVTEGLLLIVIMLLFINFIKGFFGR
ncbi:MAG: hypothetical protein FWE90_08260 [Defluviitaleaceae bacterium]|nr:hypothetical protein [Defluviitaleaceae bacterium]